MCNKRRQGLPSASRKSSLVGQQPAEALDQASDYTIRIMLSVSLLPSPDRRGKYPPARGGVRRGTGRSGRERPGPLPAPHLAEESGPQFPQFLYQVQLRISLVKFLEDISRINVSAVRESCRLMQHSCGAAWYPSPAVQRSWPAQLGHHSAKVSRERLVYLWDAIPPGLVAPMGHKSFRAPRVRPRRAAGAACVSQHSPRGPLLPATPCAGSTLIPGLRPLTTSFVAASSPHQRRSPRASIPPSVPVSGEGHLPHQRQYLAHKMGPLGPGPGGRLPTAQAVGLCRGLGARGLPALVPPKPASPHAPDRLPAQPSAALRGLYGLETLARAPASGRVPAPTWSTAPPTRPRDSKP